MIEIVNVNSNSFKYQGITYPKIYSIKRFNDKIKIFSSFDLDNELMPYVHFSSIKVDNVTYNNVADLIENLTPIVNK